MKSIILSTLLIFSSISMMAQPSIRFDLDGTEYFRMEEGRLKVLNTGNSIIIGNNAGIFDDFANKQNIFIGTDAGFGCTASQNIGIGHNALSINWTGGLNTALGAYAMSNGSQGSENTGIGWAALQQNEGTHNTALGVVALSQNVGGIWNTAVGHSSLLNNTSGNSNTGIGWGAGKMNSTGHRNVFLGFMAGYNETGSDKLYIANSAANANQALIYGDFDNAMLRINGTLDINGSFSLPTIDGSAGQVLQTNGSGILSWQNSGGGIPDKIMDADGDTKVMVEKLANENKIRFDLGGTEHFVMQGPRLEVKNSGLCVFIGAEAGANTNLSENRHNVFIGNQAGRDNTVGSYNTAIGSLALLQNFDGTSNTALGNGALLVNYSGSANTSTGGASLSSNTDGSNNTATGAIALALNTTGSDNTATGTSALYSNRAGSKATAVGAYAMQFAYNGTTAFDNFNVAVGYEALKGSTPASNNTGNWNTAIGYRTLFSNTVGSNNTSNGFEALSLNTIGSSNTAMGHMALRENKAGAKAVAIGAFAMRYANSTTSAFDNGNIAIGYEAMRGSTTPANNTGNFNTAIGFESLRVNTSGNGNTAHGYRALYSNTAAVFSTAIGYEALHTSIGNRNTAVGTVALRSNTSGDNNTAVGTFALENGTTGGNNTALGYSAHSNSGNYTNSTGIGYDADPNASNMVRIGNASVTSIGGQVSWTAFSDQRFKQNVRDDEVHGLDFIQRLRPVTYTYSVDEYDRWKTANYNETETEASEGKYDIEQIRFSGFLAQEVEQAAIASDYDFSGVDKPKNDKDVYGLRYAEFVVPLVKAMQEQQQLILDLQSNVSSLQQEIILLKSAD